MVLKAEDREWLSGRNRPDRFGSQDAGSFEAATRIGIARLALKLREVRPLGICPMVL
jgi:hypothetical protein